MTVYTERLMQAVLMSEVMQKRRHDAAITNSTTFCPWEADLISVTKSGYAHEFEIKISVADYLRERRTKSRKHDKLARAEHFQRLPNYFWYVVPENMANVQVPEYAGLMSVRCIRSAWVVDEIVSAPLLHRNKVDPKRKALLAHLLSFRLMTELWTPPPPTHTHLPSEGGK